MEFLWFQSEIKEASPLQHSTLWLDSLSCCLLLVVLAYAMELMGFNYQNFSFLSTPRVLLCQLILLLNVPRIVFLPLGQMLLLRNECCRWVKNVAQLDLLILFRFHWSSAQWLPVPIAGLNLVPAELFKGVQSARLPCRKLASLPWRKCRSRDPFLFQEVSSNWC
jgi:hypothetical protein